MTTITGTVREVVTELGSFGRITSKELIPYVGKTITIEIRKVKEVTK